MQNRLDWVDRAKGIAILLVVLQHSVIFLGDYGLLAGPWAQASAALQVLRMPLFFAASGLFAGSVIQRSWPLLWSSRLSLLVWTFLIWTVLRFAYFSAVPIESRPQETNPWLLLLAPALPTSGLWFLHALVAFFVLAKLMSGRISPVVQVVASGVLSVIFLSLPAWNISWNSMGKYLFFFIAGCHLKDTIIARVNARTWPQIIGLVVLVVAGIAGLGLLGLSHFGPLAFVVRALAVMLGFMVAAVVTGPLGRLLGYLGRNTLPIYVSHVIVIAAITSAVSHAQIPQAFKFALPVLTVVIATIVALALWRMTRSSFLKYAYEPPTWFAGKLDRATANPGR